MESSGRSQLCLVRFIERVVPVEAVVTASTGNPKRFPSESVASSEVGCAVYVDQGMFW